MTVGAEVGAAVSDDEEALHRIVGGDVNVVVCACTGTRRRLGGELVQGFCRERFISLRLARGRICTRDHRWANGVAPGKAWRQSMREFRRS